MTELKSFQSPQFGEIRTAGTSDNPLFCLADICKVLELQVTPTKNRLKPCGVNLIKVSKEIISHGNHTGAYKEEEMVFVNEQNLYKVIMRSDKPQAEPFQDWVCGEVLPSIRKTGGYSLNIPKTFAEALRLAADQQEQIEKQQLLIAEQKPKADYFDELVARGALTNIRTTAKQIGIPQNTFVGYLLHDKYLYRNHKGQLLPYAQYNNDLFQVKDYKSDNHTGQQTFITTHGKETFRLRYGA